VDEQEQVHARDGQSDVERCAYVTWQGFVQGLQMGPSAGKMAGVCQVG
jgi:hypothetical protein